MSQHSTARRYSRLTKLAEQPELQALELWQCSRDPVHWFNEWVWTYNPKLKKNKFLPMELFPKQEEAVRWFFERMREGEDGLFEKSRDIGFTWLAGGAALHQWLFVPGFKATFGSRKAEYVDRIGDPDSIFEKIRMIYRNLPGWMLPPNFSPRNHDKSMLLENPDLECYIRGESGDDMGRGGRSSVYFLDEFAFVEHAESVDASTSANAECRIFGSSVNGMGNLFARKRFGGQMRSDQIFRFHYTDDPRKNNPEWVAQTRSKVEAHTWASEYDIDYSASVEGICILAKWVEAAKVIRQRLSAVGKSLPISVSGVAGGDVGAGKAKSVLVPRFGVEVRLPTSWSDPDTIDTANRMIIACKSATVTRDQIEYHVKTLRFDATGVGHGVGASLRRSDEGVSGVPVLVGNPASDTVWPDGKTSNEKFANIKAESWWTAREKFKATWEYLQWMDGALDGEGNPIGREHPLEDLISLPPDSASPDALKLSSQISLVKWGTQPGGKIIIESKDALAKRGISSPDYADALMLTFTPATAGEKLMRAYAA